MWGPEYLPDYIFLCVEIFVINVKFHSTPSLESKREAYDRYGSDILRNAGK